MPFDQWDVAEDAGAVWDPDRHLWYAPDERAALVERWPGARWLNVPSAAAEEARRLGAVWDLARRLWYAERPLSAARERSLRLFVSWGSARWLRVPYAEKDKAKALGARWVEARQRWLAPNGEPALVEQWGHWQWLYVPYGEKEAAKALGARWDAHERRWYAPHSEPALLERWGEWQWQWLRVPYAEKEEAKALGARWDPDRRLWYGPNGNPALVARWGKGTGAVLRDPTHQRQPDRLPSRLLDNIPRCPDTVAGGHVHAGPDTACSGRTSRAPDALVEVVEQLQNGVRDLWFDCLTACVPGALPPHETLGCPWNDAGGLGSGFGSSDRARTAMHNLETVVGIDGDQLAELYKSTTDVDHRQMQNALIHHFTIRYDDDMQVHGRHIRVLQ